MESDGRSTPGASLELGHIELFVADAGRSKQFYRDLLGAEVISEQGDGQFVWIRLGDATVLLRQIIENSGEASSVGAPARYDHTQVGLVLYSNDTDAVVNQLMLNGVEFGPPDGSERCFTFIDPDGHWLQLVNPSEH